MSKEITEQAKLEAGSVKTFKVLITTNKGSKEWSFISECIHLEMEAMKSQYPEGFTWDVLEFGKDII